MKFQKTVSVIIGALLLLAGLGYLFEIFSISPKEWFLLAAGVVLLLAGMMKRKSLVRDIGIFCTAVGAAVLGESFPFLSAYMKPVYYVAVAAAVLAVGLCRKNKWMYLIGIVTAALGVFEFLQCADLPRQLSVAYSLILLATAFVVLFIFKNRDFGYMPFILGIMCYLLSVPEFLVHAKYITVDVAQAIRAGLLIVTGVIIMIKVYTIGKKEKNSEQ